ncbi:MAG TPA: hypothetical protein VF688_00895, partial [Allosphingosinicella sp.]
MRRRLAAWLLLLAPPGPAAAQQVVTSPAAEAVSVTIYRNPGRSFGRPIELEWLGGYALITETRIVDLPAGESVIRFEGVAGSILPVSAVVSGLPRPLSEKNYDARLLSAGALVDSSLGRQVHIRRTDRATGRTVETEAIIRSGPDGIVLQTSEGIEALRCTGLPETLVYREVPPDLSARPTLALRTSAASATRATLRLSYLAGQFDWQANYVANLSRDGRTIDLFAWMTLANGNDESFAAAQTQTVAGQIDRDEDGTDSGPEPVSPEIHLQCWPSGTTSDVPYTEVPPPPPMAEYEMSGADIVVTGSRVRRPNLMSMSPITAISAQQEELGDLKLYRIPEPVTVAANAQKQVALLTKPRVPVERLLGLGRDATGDDEDPVPLSILLRMKNVKKRGLGLPLPSGSLAIFEQPGDRPMLVGETAMRDYSVGEDVEILVGSSADAWLTHRQLESERRKKKGDSRAGDDGADEDDEDRDRRRYELVVTNARAVPATVELELWVYGRDRLVRPSRKLGMKNGSHLWRARVPANGRARLTYVV